MTRSLVHHLEELPHRSVLTSVSALDMYYNLPEGRVLRVHTEADLIGLTKAFDELEYPGVDGVDAVLSYPEGCILFTCVESVRTPLNNAFTVANFAYDPAAMIYLDKSNAYGDLRRKLLRIADGVIFAGNWKILTEAAVLLARYDFQVEEGMALERLAPGEYSSGMTSFEQRILLEELLMGKNAKAGFKLLRASGFVDEHWGDLAAMYGVTHSKEHHPEGNVWEHTLETFGYRKTTDLALSYSLLFHDSGKPLANTEEGNKFNRHAQIGGSIASRFLRKLGYDEGLVKDVNFLVREHMLPSFLHELAMFRTEKVMSSQLFPLLLELYRCDLSSTYRGPDGYYRACKVYRSYLKNVRNPFRTPAGKKILKAYVDGGR